VLFCRGLTTEDYTLDATISFVDDTVDGEQGDAKMTDEKKTNAEENGEDGEEQDEEATKADLWESGVLGGYECYVEGGEGPPEEGYDTMAKGGNDDEDEEEEGGPLIKSTPKSNALCLALRDAGVMKCVSLSLVCVCVYVCVLED
jgi:hypothetical protein